MLVEAVGAGAPAAAGGAASAALPAPARAGALRTVSVGSAMPARRVLDPAKAGDHLDRLYRAAWALCGSRERAEDLVQDTYVRVLTRPRLLRGDDDLGYLLRALRNTFISQHRATRARPVTTSADELEWMEDRRSPQPDAVLEARLVYELIAELPADFRDALVAVDVIGLSYREASRSLRVREGTLTSRLFRARQQLAHRLRDADVDQ